LPAAVTTSRAGAVSLVQTAYRAPVWPQGVDVIEAVLKNSGDQAAEACLELRVPEKMAMGERVGSIEGRPSLALPADLSPARDEREWGCAGGVNALPGWGKPNRPCDPAFKSIAAGMGGVPITYRFAVPPGSRKRVVLGFCESHHADAGERIMALSVEGAAPQILDPISRWGRHTPGVVRFDACDADKNGRLQITAAPDATTHDRNPILNAIWIFAAGSPVDDAQLIAGAMNGSAERFVDVGGANDQSLYPPGNLRYTLALKPGEQRRLFLLVRCPGCLAVPDPDASTWNASSLRKAAADVWRDRWTEQVAAAPTPPAP
jgi:hypothetical protein